MTRYGFINSGNQHSLSGERVRFLFQGIDRIFVEVLRSHQHYSAGERIELLSEEYSEEVAIPSVNG